MGPPPGIFAELARWRDKASKQIDCTFTSEIIPDWLSVEVKAGLEVAGVEAFGFLKQIDAARQAVERRLRLKINRILREYEAQAVEAIEAGREPDYDAFFASMRTAIQPEVTAMVTSEAMRASTELGIVFDPAVINTEAVRWARQYTAKLSGQVTDTTRRMVGEVTASFFETPGMTTGDLRRILNPAFGPVRAEMIAITEVTRAHSEAINEIQQMVNRTGLPMRRVWHTANDDIVCAICGPLNGKPEEDWRGDFPYGPPAHPRCRCAEGLSLSSAEEERARAAELAAEREAMLRETGQAPTPAGPAEGTAEWARTRIVEQGTADQVRIDELQSKMDEILERGKEIIKPMITPGGVIEEGKTEAQLWDEYHKIMAEKTPFYEEWKTLYYGQDERLRQFVYVDSPASPDIKLITRFTGLRKKRFENGVAGFRQLVGTGTMDGVHIEVRGTRKARSYQQGGNVYLHKNVGPRVTVHELGHALEHNDPEVHRKALDFLDRRTQGETAEWLGDKYDRRETSRKDKFLSPYMGKDYGRHSTEIVSMGMEYMWQQPLKLATEDPGYFDFMYNLLRGQ